jgi:FMN-dependent NADH-azoreductase
MNILYVNACVRNVSRTNKLAQYALSKLEGNTEEINLDSEKIVPLYKEQLELRDSLIKDKNYNHPMFKYAKQFANADVILISAPYWDLSFPAILKTYIENVNINGITFSYSEKGYPVSLCKAKKLIYITTSGGPIISDEFGFGYIKSLAENFYGIKDINYIKTEGLDIWGANIQEILEKAKKEVDEKI